MVEEERTEEIISDSRIDVSEEMSRSDEGQPENLEAVEPRGFGYCAFCGQPYIRQPFQQYDR